MNRTAAWLFAAAVTAVAPHVGAQDFPTRTVTVTVPGQPGASSDIVGRVLAKELGAKWGSPVVVENRPGSGGL